MFRWLRWGRAKAQLASHPLDDDSSCFQANDASVDTLVPNAEPYSTLATVWNDYAESWAPDYARFLLAAEDYYRQPIHSVLDLACGTGCVTRLLAKQFAVVMGLDISAAMLTEARSRSPDGTIRYLLGDYGEFALNHAFDAVVCARDSLNYIRTPDELTKVFGCVHEHLRANGVFVFDVLDHISCQGIAKWKVVSNKQSTPFAIYFFYDRVTRISDDRVVCDGIVERHKRIPIEESDIRQAAETVGLRLVDQFSGNPAGIVLRKYFVLRK